MILSLIIVVIIAMMIWPIHVSEQFRMSLRLPYKNGVFRNPVKWSRGGTNAAPASSSSNAIVPASGASAGVSSGASAGSSVGTNVQKASGWQKADTIFGGLNLATLPLFFLPIGAAAGAAAGGEEYQQTGDPAAAASVSSSSSISSMVLVLMAILLVVSMQS